MTDNTIVVVDQIKNLVEYNGVQQTVIQPVNINQEVIVNNQEIVAIQSGINQYTIQFHNISQLPYIDTRNTEFIYDTNGDLVRVNKSDNTYKMFEYNLDGSINTITDGSNIWNYVYDSNGNLINILVE